MDQFGCVWSQDVNQVWQLEVTLRIVPNSETVNADLKLALWFFEQYFSRLCPVYFFCTLLLTPWSPEGPPVSLFQFLALVLFKVFPITSLRAITRLLSWNPIGITAPRALVNINYNERESWAYGLNREIEFGWPEKWCYGSDHVL